MLTLQEILYGTWVPPESTKVRSHRIGMSGGHRYIAPKPRNSTRDESGLNKSERAVLKALQKCKGYASAADVAVKAKMTRNHCQIILSSLHKAGKALRYKVSGNGTRYFMYCIKEAI